MRKVDKRRSFGFEQDGVTIREDEAAIIRDHARRLLAGETQASLIAELIANGIPSVYGARWGYTDLPADGDAQTQYRPNRPQWRSRWKASGSQGYAILDELTHDRLTALYAEP